MVQEASQVLHRRILREKGGVDAYDALYDADQKAVTLSYHSNISVQLLTDRDKYMATFARACLAAKELIQISTCYLFWTDPAQTYILFDLLPFIVQRGVKVQILFDLMVMESITFKSPFYTTNEKPESTRKSAQPCHVTATSFWEHLPKHCPPATARVPPSVVSIAIFLFLF